MVAASLHGHCKLGRQATRADKRAAHPQLGSMIAHQAGRPFGAPSSRRWTQRPTVPPTPVAFGTFHNLDLGSCASSSFGHFDQVVGEHTYSTPVVTPDVVLKAYEDCGGYKPGHPETDNGSSMVDELAWYRRFGTVASSAAINPHATDVIECSIDLLGGVYCGFDLPISAQRQTVWDTAPPGQRDDSYDRNSWGGHAVFVFDYDQTGLWCATWGTIKRMTRAWFASYIDECYAVLHTRWAQKLAPSGYLGEQIASAMLNLRAMPWT